MCKISRDLIHDFFFVSFLFFFAAERGPRVGLWAYGWIYCMAGGRTRDARARSMGVIARS